MSDTVTLDDINLRLLTVLQTQARLTSAQVSDHLGLSQSACLERWRKLEKQGVIRRYRTDIDLDRVTSNIRVFCEVSLDPNRPEALRPLIADCMAVPEVVAIYRNSGAYDLLVSVVCRDVRHYHDLTDGLIARNPAILRFSGHVVLHRIKVFQGYPLATLTGRPLPPAEPAPMQTTAAPLRLDGLHLKILTTLQTEGRISNLALAERVALSPSPCLERVKRLEQHGYIAQYVTEIDLERCLPHLYLMAEASLGNHGIEEFRRFEAAMSSFPEIISSYKIAGPFDYTMDIICRDWDHFRALEQRLAALCPALCGLRVAEVKQRLKHFAGFPLPMLSQGEVSLHSLWKS